MCTQKKMLIYCWWINERVWWLCRVAVYTCTICLLLLHSRYGLRHVFPTGGHVGGESEQDWPQGHGAHHVPSDAPGGLPQGDRPPLHVLLLGRRGLLRWHQLGQLSHLGLAGAGDRRLTSSWQHVTKKTPQKNNKNSWEMWLICNKWCEWCWLFFYEWFCLYFSAICFLDIHFE